MTVYLHLLQSLTITAHFERRTFQAPFVDDPSANQRIHPIWWFDHDLHFNLRYSPSRVTLVPYLRSQDLYGARNISVRAGAGAGKLIVLLLVLNKRLKHGTLPEFPRTLLLNLSNSNTTFPVAKNAYEMCQVTSRKMDSCLVISSVRRCFSSCLG